MIKQLTDSIRLIGPEFEAFAGIFLDHIMRTPLDHSGLNMFGFPVSQVLDSTSDDGQIVAQYSAKGGYFTAKMTKAPGSCKSDWPSGRRNPA
jgi:hypothetical protein